MKQIHRVLAVVSLAGVFAMSGRANATVTILTNISVRELVYVLNDKTPLRVNLENRRYLPTDRLDLPCTNLAHFRVEDLKQVMSNLTNYALVTNGNAYVIVPNKSLGKPDYPLNYVVPDFFVTNVHPSVALEILQRRLPFVLAEGTGDWFIPSNKVVTIVKSRATVRELLCDMYNGPINCYWIAPPVPKAAVKELGWGPGAVYLYVYPSGHYIPLHGHMADAWVYSTRDPVLVKQRLAIYHQHNRDISITETNLPDQAFELAIFGTEDQRGGFRFDLRVNPWRLAETNHFLGQWFKATLMVSNATDETLECPLVLGEGNHDLRTKTGWARVPALSSSFFLSTNLAEHAYVRLDTASKTERRPDFMITVHYHFRLKNFIYRDDDD